MVENFRVNLGFARDPDDKLADRADNVVTDMTANASFPAPPLDPVTGLKPLVVTFRATILAANNGGKTSVLISTRNDAREALITGLRQEAAYVQSLAGQDMTMLLSSGFKANSTNHTSVTLATPSILHISNTSTTKLVVQSTPDPNASAYQSRLCVSGGAWLTIATSTDSRKITHEGLVPGTTYVVQSRSVGGATGYSDWSTPVIIMCT